MVKKRRQGGIRPLLPGGEPLPAVAGTDWPVWAVSVSDPPLPLELSLPPLPLELSLPPLPLELSLPPLPLELVPPLTLEPVLPGLPVEVPAAVLGAVVGRVVAGGGGYTQVVPSQ